MTLGWYSPVHNLESGCFCFMLVIGIHWISGLVMSQYLQWCLERSHISPRVSFFVPRRILSFLIFLEVSFYYKLDSELSFYSRIGPSLLIETDFLMVLATFHFPVSVMFLTSSIVLIFVKKYRWLSYNSYPNTISFYSIFRPPHSY